MAPGGSGWRRPGKGTLTPTHPPLHTSARTQKAFGMERRCPRRQAKAKTRKEYQRGHGDTESRRKGTLIITQPGISRGRFNHGRERTQMQRRAQSQTRATVQSHTPSGKRASLFTHEQSCTDRHIQGPEFSHTHTGSHAHSHRPQFHNLHPCPACSPQLYKPHASLNLAQPSPTTRAHKHTHHTKTSKGAESGLLCRGRA